MSRSTHVILTADDLAVLERRLGSGHDLCERVRSALSDAVDPILNTYRHAARRLAHSGELEIDPGAVVSKGDDPGAYVMAWLWISDADAGIRSADSNLHSANGVNS